MTDDQPAGILSLNTCQTQVSVAELEFVVFDSFPSVQTLTVEYGVLDPIRTVRWSQYFPNVSKLCTSYYSSVPMDFISQLTTF